MGYTTDFHGRFAVTPALKREHVNYLKAFAGSRRMQRDPEKLAGVPDPLREAAKLGLGEQGGYYVGAHEDNYGQDDTGDVLDHNRPPSGQPGLWCQWVPTDDGEHIEWDGSEKFHAYVEWLGYVVSHFLEPWGYKVNGEVEWSGEDSDDLGKIVVTNNEVMAKHGRITYD
jgi:hypothetical protein